MDSNYEAHEETAEVAGFIAKTFEILNVRFLSFRIKIFLESFTGHKQEPNLSSRTSTSFSKLYCQNSSDTTR